MTADGRGLRLLMRRAPRASRRAGELAARLPDAAPRLADALGAALRREVAVRFAGCVTRRDWSPTGPLVGCRETSARMHLPGDGAGKVAEAVFGMPMAGAIATRAAEAVLGRLAAAADQVAAEFGDEAEGPLLVATYEASWPGQEGPPLTVDLVGTPALGPSVGDHPVLDELPLDVLGVLARLSLPVSALARLSPGMVLPLHAGSIEAVRLEAGPSHLATGAWGRNGTARAIEIAGPTEPALRVA